MPNPDQEFDRGQTAIAANSAAIYFVGGFGAANKFYGQFWLWADGWILNMNNGAKP